MQVLIILVIIGSLSIFWLQNPQPIALIFFGSPTSRQLSLGTWILIFAAGGAISSLLIQLLARGGSLLKSERKAQRYKPPSEPPEPPDRPPLRRPPERDWENTEDEEWEIETPPKTPFIPTPPPFDSRPQPKERQPSVYSYIPSPELRTKPPIDEDQVKEEPAKPPIDEDQVKEEPAKPPIDEDQVKEEPAKPPVDRNSVYDANYRVINPPYKSPNITDRENIDEEDWI